MISRFFSKIGGPAGPSRLVRLILPGLLLLCVVSAGRAVASTYYVDAARPDDAGDGLSWAAAKQTIQAAIGASAMGDTILVKYGTYAPSGAILIDSTRLLTSDDGTHDSWDSADHDSSLCVVSPSTVKRVFTISGAAVTTATRIRGFKITGGVATSESPGALYGGGIYVAGDADPTIEHCWVTGNTASKSGNGYGGGIACRGAGTEAVIRYCKIDHNIGSTSWGADGGGLYFESAGLCKVHENVIEDNKASSARIGYGGGISSYTTNVLIWSNTITNNVATISSGAGGRGGGIYIYRGNVEIWGNTITHNRASEGNAQAGHGGGIYHGGGASGESITIRDNPAISFNTAATAGVGYGGGIAVEASYLEVYGNTLEGNVASSSSHTTASYRIGYGGGIFMNSGGNTIRENVIVNNTASVNGAGYGGGLRLESNQAIIRNIFAFNTGSTSIDGAGYGGGCWYTGLNSGVMTNNTFYRNANVIYPGATGAGSGLYHEGSSFPAVVNNIVAGHDVAHSDSMGFYSTTAYTISYNCFYDNPRGNYTANVTSNNEELADPRLVDPSEGDFSLGYDSSCIEEGNPTYGVPEDGAWVVDIGAIEYTGTRHRRPIASTGEYLFGGRVKAKVNVTTLGTLSEVDMVVHPGETHSVAPVSVARWYEIDHAGSGMEFDLTLTYLDAELNGRTEDQLVVWRWTGITWDGPKSYSARDLAANWITVAAQTNFSDWILTDEWGPTGIDDAPARFALHANHPNPFNPSTTIAYELARSSHVRLDVYNAAGQLVRVLVDADRGPGRHQLEWDGRDRHGRGAASGVYFYRLQAAEFEQSRKMVLVR